MDILRIRFVHNKYVYFNVNDGFWLEDLSVRVANSEEIRGGGHRRNNRSHGFRYGFGFSGFSFTSSGRSTGELGYFTCSGVYYRDDYRGFGCPCYRYKARKVSAGF